MATLAVFAGAKILHDRVEVPAQKRLRALMPRARAEPEIRPV